MPAYVPPAALTGAAINAALGYTAANAATVVNSVNGVAGAVTAANIATAATAGYGYTPASKDQGGNVVGSFAIAYPSGVSPVANATLAGSSLVFSNTGGGALAGGSAAGTWRNCEGATIPAGQVSLFQRIA